MMGGFWGVQFKVYDGGTSTIPRCANLRRWEYHGLNETSMRYIYEFTEGFYWTRWPNLLPVPVHNNTVVPINEHDACDKVETAEIKTWIAKDVSVGRTMFLSEISGGCRRRSMSWTNLKLVNPGYKGEDASDRCHGPINRALTYTDAKRYCQKIFYTDKIRASTSAWEDEAFHSGFYSNTKFKFHWLGIIFTKNK